MRAACLVMLMACHSHDHDHDHDHVHDHDSDAIVDPTDPATPDAIESLDLFQAVAIPLLDEERLAPIVAGRPAVVRGSASVSGNLVLSLELTTGGTAETFSSGSDLVVEIPATSVATDTRWSATLTDGGTVVQRVPATGGLELGAIETGPLHVRVVPYQVDGKVPDTSAAVIEGMRTALYAVYPVTEVTIDVDEVQVWTEAYDLGSINVAVGVRQETAMGAGEVPWNTYYYAIANGGLDSRDDYMGITGTSEDGGGGSLVRAYFAAGAAFGDQRSEDTLIHEMGHVHGLEHAPCDGESNVDRDYPYAEAAIGVEGYDLRTGTFVPADSKDMMSYCYPRWISPYHYALLAEHVVAAQDYEGYR